MSPPISINVVLLSSAASITSLTVKKVYKTSTSGGAIVQASTANYNLPQVVFEDIYNSAGALFSASQPSTNTVNI